MLSDYSKPTPRQQELGDRPATLQWADFHADDHRLSIDGSSLTRDRTWPSFDTDTMSCHQAIRRLALEADDDKGTWLRMAKSWLSILLQLGTLVQTSSEPRRMMMSLGAIGTTVTLHGMA